MGKYEFKPDSLGRNPLERLNLTKNQKQAMVRGLMIAAVMLFLLIVEDVAFARFKPFGGSPDLLVAAAFLTCILLRPERGGKAAIWISLFYLFSGSAPGYYVVAFIPVLGIGLSLFRQSYLQLNFSSAVFCSAVALALYELLVFVVELFLNTAVLSSFFAVIAGLVGGLIVLPILYPLLAGISRFGGNTWIE